MSEEFAYFLNYVNIKIKNIQSSDFYKNIQIISKISERTEKRKELQMRNEFLYYFIFVLLRISGAVALSPKTRLCLKIMIKFSEK